MHDDIDDIDAGPGPLFGYAVPGDPPPGHSSHGRLEHLLRRGVFAITAELNPPDSSNPRDVFARAAVLSEVCDAINSTDASGANVHMSSIGVCALLTRANLAPVMQVSCRDRNRIAVQGDVLAAAAMGVCNILCLTGDGVGIGDQPEAMPVFDLDSISLLHTIRGMRDEGLFLSGRRITAPPRVFLGAAANPFSPPHAFRPPRMAKKIAAGAQFFQTNYCFDLAQFRDFMTRVRALGLHEKSFILAGVGPLMSAKSARWMNNRLPGVYIPEAVIARMEGAADPKKEGGAICVETIQQLREIEGVHGIHIMAYRQEEMVADIVQRSGVLDDRKANDIGLAGLRHAQAVRRNKMLQERAATVSDEE